MHPLNSHSELCTEAPTPLHHHHDKFVLHLLNFPIVNLTLKSCDNMIFAVFAYSYTNPLIWPIASNDRETVSSLHCRMILNPHHILPHAPGFHFKSNITTHTFCRSFKAVPVATHSNSYPLFFPSPPMSITHCFLTILLLYSCFLSSHPNTMGFRSWFLTRKYLPRAVQLQ